jgi:hypothetical protein
VENLIIVLLEEMKSESISMVNELEDRQEKGESQNGLLNHLASINSKQATMAGILIQILKGELKSSG